MWLSFLLFFPELAASRILIFCTYYSERKITKASCLCFSCCYRQNNFYKILSAPVLFPRNLIKISNVYNFEASRFSYSVLGQEKTKASCLCSPCCSGLKIWSEHVSTRTKWQCECKTALTEMILRNFIRSVSFLVLIVSGNFSFLN